MPRVGSSKISTSQLPREPLGEHDLLLIAAGEVARALLLVRHFDSAAARRSGRTPRARGRAARSRAGESRVRFGRPKFSRTECAEHEALQLAILGQQADARARWRRAASGSSSSLPSSRISPASRGSAPKISRDRFRAPRADEPGERQDLAAAHGEGNIAHRPAAAQAGHFQARRADAPRCAREIRPSARARPSARSARCA